MGVQIILCDTAFNSGRVYIKIELLDHTVILSVIFCRTAVMFSTVAATTHVPTSKAQEFQFFHILANTCYLLVSVFLVLLF